MDKNYLPEDAFGNHLLKMEDAPKPTTSPAKLNFNIGYMTREQLIKKVKRELRTGS